MGSGGFALGVHLGLGRGGLGAMLILRGSGFSEMTGRETISTFSEGGLENARG